MLEKLTVEEAIELFERESPNKECNHDRRQLAMWLRELRDLRKLVNESVSHIE